MGAGAMGPRGRGTLFIALEVVRPRTFSALPFPVSLCSPDQIGVGGGRVVVEEALNLAAGAFKTQTSGSFRVPWLYFSLVSNSLWKSWGGARVTYFCLSVRWWQFGFCH